VLPASAWGFIVGPELASQLMAVLLLLSWLPKVNFALLARFGSRRMFCEAVSCGYACDDRGSATLESFILLSKRKASTRLMGNFCGIIVFIIWALISFSQHRRQVVITELLSTALLLCFLNFISCY
jgi:hypothetical protein